MKRGLPFVNRNKQKKVHRKPLRSFTELYKDFGVTRGVLQAAMGRYSAPPAVLHSGGNRWYDPAEMRKWWEALPRSVATLPRSSL